MCGSIPADIMTLTEFISSLELQDAHTVQIQQYVGISCDTSGSYTVLVHFIDISNIMISMYH